MNISRGSKANCMLTAKQVTSFVAYTYGTCVFKFCAIIRRLQRKLKIFAICHFSHMLSEHLLNSTAVTDYYRLCGETIDIARKHTKV
jgi:hypothetical protein